MTTVAFVLFVLAVTVMVGVHAWTLNRMEERVAARQAALDQADEGRRVALYQQQKAAQTEIAKTQRAVQVLADQSRALHDETRLAHQRNDALARDVKQALGRGDLH
jgi:hypothetical protein